MFIGRKKEIDYFEGIYQSNKAEFITLYGRRRIGKTELLKQVSKGRKHIFYSAKECTDYEQLSSISEKILGKGKRFEHWEALFEHIGQEGQSESLIVILDEFPYMVKGNSSLPSIIQNTWDHMLKDTKIKLIICGSSMSFIEKEILSEKMPLYGRMSGVYKLDELEYDDARKFFPKYDEINAITVYSILGGVPHYLLQFDANIGIKANVCNAILNKGRILYNEVDFLLKQEMREPQVYYTIIEKIAFGATKLNEIHTKTQISTNKLAVYLKNLIELGIVCKEYPITEKIKTKVNLHSGIYKLSSHYFEFYFRFVFSNISDLEEGLIEDVYDYDIEPYLNTYIGHNYEKICISKLKKKIRSSHEPYRIKHIGRWWNKQEEIDIVGFENANFIVAECKWRNQKLTMNVLDNLIQKVEKNLNYNQIHYYLFSKSGFADTVIKRAKEDNLIHLVEVLGEKY